MALHALSRMETRKYHSGSSDSLSTREENGNTSDTESTLSVHSEGRNSKCVICLEKFKEGQVIASFFFTNWVDHSKTSLFLELSESVAHIGNPQRKKITLVFLFNPQ